MTFQFSVVWHGKGWEIIFQENDFLPMEENYFLPMEENDFHFEKMES